MFPGVDGFHWTFGHVLFLAVFFGVLLTLAATLTAAVARARRDLAARRAEKIQWKADFEEMPKCDRSCRHELAGRVTQRTCGNAFECGSCAEHEQFAPLPAAAGDVCGLEYPEGRLYHRGHTWVEPLGDGTVKIGLDDLAARLIGTPDAVELPPRGGRIEAQGTGWTIQKNGVTVRVLAPVTGDVVETGGDGGGCYLRVRPDGEEVWQRRLLRGPEVAGWVRRELEKLQVELVPNGSAPALADGGELVRGVMDAAPEAKWDRVVGRVFLDC